MRSAMAVGLGEERNVSALADPTTILNEREQYVTTDTLDFLAGVTRQGTILTCYPVIGGTADLNSGTSNLEEQRGLNIIRNDMSRWLPVLQHYGWVKPEIIISNRLTAEDATLIVNGFSRMLGCIVEGVCFLFSTNLRLPQQNLREDLLIIRHRCQAVANAADEGLLQIEVSVHQLNGHVSLMTEKLLILASRAKSQQPIYGSEHAVPAVAEARRTQRRTRATLGVEDFKDYDGDTEVVV